jgi:hypothetical protein
MDIESLAISHILGAAPPMRTVLTAYSVSFGLIASHTGQG